jgi:hypothetical protein
MHSHFSRESHLVHRFLTLVRASEPSTGHDVAAQLYPDHMPFSAPTRANQILAQLMHRGWLESIDMRGRDPTPKGYMLSLEGRKVLEELDKAS